MTEYEQRYKQLNLSQKLAIDNLEGPVLVIAGPGTGKTEMLGVRIAKILMDTDTSPEDILCLTFTNEGANTMRRRIIELVGKEGHRVQIHTYHSFGSFLLQSYPEFFEERQFLTKIDELKQWELVDELLRALPYTDPLKRHSVDSVLSAIKKLKEGLITPEKARSLVKIGQTEATKLEAVANKHLKGIRRAPSGEKASNLALKILKDIPGGKDLDVRRNMLKKAIEEYESGEGKNPISIFMKKWFFKKKDDTYISQTRYQHKVLVSLAGLLESYQAKLIEANLYDYSDMIVSTIEKLRTDPDFKATIQERFLYVLLDEFQDTNEAQFELVRQLTDYANPNVLAVGDDDQAIMGFQGGDAKYFQLFHNHFKAKVINLTDNYRSHKEIIDLSSHIQVQIGAGADSDSFSHDKPEFNKELNAINGKGATIVRYSFSQYFQEYSFVAEQANRDLENGTVAVIAPKHKYLVELAKFFHVTQGARR